ncbi:MAG: N-acetylmuramoyl-L-alanine amidase [Acidobacteria bacterium]|nr:N-acetylmuramoyl-L-alanine amidase [Acidobacteriota bacterium]
MSAIVTPDMTLAYSRIVERYAHFFDKPEVRLRFFNKTLAKQIASCEKLSQSLSRFSFIKKSRYYQLLLDWWLYVLIIREVNQFSQAESKQVSKIRRIHKIPVGSLFLFYAYKLRFVLGVLCVAGVIMTTVGLYKLASNYLRRSDAPIVMRNSQSVDAEANSGLAKYLPDYKPVKVWLVEQKDDFERYSNGLRILREYETTNHRRGYNLFRPDGGGKIGPELLHDPVGIVYHTSESDILPFISENNNSIESRSRDLLNYVKNNKSYNYVIDRFGQVYRIVRDDQAANHAGNSIWADQKGVYVGLNESFLGVSFETKSDANLGDEQLTEAQVLAGRLLTQILRSRHNIEDADCVTHGLVSVNPDNMLVSYHHDWVKNFPFEAMGLSDKYQTVTASISVYGFTYDAEIAGYAGGNIWPGAKAAEKVFENRAEQAQIDTKEMRRRMRDLYRVHLAQQNSMRRLSTDDQATKVGTPNAQPNESLDSVPKSNNSERVDSQRL